MEFLPETNIAPEDGLELSVNNWVGSYAAILTHQQPANYKWGQFGFCPAWADKRLYLFNVRVEKLNAGNDTNYTGSPEKEKYSKPYLIRR